MKQLRDHSPDARAITNHPLLSAPHILLDVFLQLPQQDLLLIQRVCRVWREVITSSRVLQAALFLGPPVNVNDALNETVRMNPLLLSRFPAFFDNHLNHADLCRTQHGMGPYYTTHWAESIRPWCKFVRPGLLEECSMLLGSLDSDSLSKNANDEHSIPGVTASLVSVPEHIDPNRTAAYRRPNASWRRMLPCIPPPIELQIRYQTGSRQPIAGTLHRLRFNTPDTCHASSPTDDSRRDDRDFERRWLTFGLVYDLFEAAWFRGQPSGVDKWQFDWTFQDIRPPMQDAAAAEACEMPTMEESDNVELYRERKRLRDCLADTPIGGTGRMLILLTEYNKGRHDPLYGERRFRADFELLRLDGNAIVWDEIIPYRIG